MPSRDKLTYTNGFYVDVSAMFVDIRESTSLSRIHRRPTLAKIYRSFISEVVAIMNGNETCHEINIIGDCVSGIFATKTKPDIDELFSREIKTEIRYDHCAEFPWNDDNTIRMETDNYIDLLRSINFVL